MSRPISPKLQLGLTQSALGKMLPALEQLADGAPGLAGDVRKQLDPKAAPAPAPATKETMAGNRMIKFLSGPMGEEILEGVLGGTMVVAPQFFTEEDPRENALQLALAIGGGIGLGMAGRRIGAHIGERLHPGEITHEGLASVVRLGGHETVGEGMASLAATASANRGRELMDTTARNLRQDLQRLGDQEFTAAYPDLAKAGMLPSTATPAQLQQLEAFQGATSSAARQTVELEAKEAKRIMEKLAEEHPQVAAAMREQGLSPEQTEQAWAGRAAPVTGEHAGRLAGRIFGDEIGILSGAGIGALIAGQLGWQSPKDAQIAQLKAQLAQANS
jgi:hypothetical protein